MCSVYNPPNSSAEDDDALLHLRPLSGVYLLSPPDCRYLFSTWCSSNSPGTPSSPPTRFGRSSSMIFDPWPQPPPPVKLSWRLKNAGKMLNCWGSGKADRGGAGGSTAPAHAELLNSTVLLAVRWLSDGRSSSAALRASWCRYCAPASPSARLRRSLTNHIIVPPRAMPCSPHAAPRANCSRLRETPPRHRPRDRVKRTHLLPPESMLNLYRDAVSRSLTRGGRPGAVRTANGVLRLL